MNPEVPVEISELMARLRSGDRQAAGALVDRFYPELRRIAASKMRKESTDHTWSPTTLVHELYLELLKIRGLRAAAAASGDRDAFLGLAGFLMRRLLIHHARRSYRQAHKEPIAAIEAMDYDGSIGVEALAEVEELLRRLGDIDPSLRSVVEMRVFEGKTIAETALALGCSERTVQNRWDFARRWLEHEMPGVK